MKKETMTQASHTPHPISQKAPSSNQRLTEILHVLKSHHVVQGLTPKKLRHILEDLGPTYVKLGQIMSMRSDMLPENYCKELTLLRTEVKPLPFETIHKVLEEEWHCPIDTIVKDISKTPLGSASIAQVHSAILQTGQKVVLKVQRPHIKEMMEQDIRLIKHASKLIKVAIGTGELIDFKTVLDELWKTSQEEMDFTTEAHNLEQFYQNQKEIIYITCPQVLKQFTTSKVLVMDYIEGIQIDHIEELEKNGYNRVEIGRKTAENYCKQILEDGFFHADPHPGNLWVSNGQIAWLDLGMTGHLSAYNKQILKRAIMAILKNDMYELKNVLLAFGEAKSPIDHARLYTDIADIVQKYMSIGFGTMDLGKLIEKLLDLIKFHNISISPDITLLGRSMITMEGTLKICAPEVNMMDILSAHMSQQFLKELDLKHELKHKARLLYASMDKSLEIPALLSDLLNITKNGQTKLNLEFANMQAQKNSFQHISYQIILCFLACFLFLGSCILCLSDLEPQIFSMPWISFFGFLLSFLFILWLIFSMIRHRK